MAVIRLAEARSRPWIAGPEGFLLRVRDLIDRGRLDIAQVRLSEITRWLIHRAQNESSSSLSELCGVLEHAARLALLKARRLSGMWQAAQDEEVEPWAGPPPELPLRRSWLGERVAQGTVCFSGPARIFDDMVAALAPVTPRQLREAMATAIGRHQQPPPITSSFRMPWASVEGFSNSIMERLSQMAEFRLTEVLTPTRDAHVAAFLACLALARQGRIDLEQEELFGEIVIRAASESLEATA